MSNYLQNTAIKDLCLNKFDAAYKKEHSGCSKMVAHETFADFLKELTARNDLTEAEEKKVDALKQQLKQCNSDPENASIWSKKIIKYLNGNGIKQSIMYDNSSKWVESGFDVGKALMDYRDKSVQLAEALRLLSDSQFLCKALDDCDYGSSSGSSDEDEDEDDEDDDDEDDDDEKEAKDKDLARPTKMEKLLHKLEARHLRAIQSSKRYDSSFIGVWTDGVLERVGIDSSNSDEQEELQPDLVVKCEVEKNLFLDVLVMEVKNANARSNQLMSDKCKIAMYLKRMVDEQVAFGVKSPVAIGMKVEGNEVEIYIGKLGMKALSGFFGLAVQPAEKLR
ncbi:hypothetical protein BD560DRAFT_494408 [Blakeslea trispora]|nr:hypothetical protein BD560DRAFT_494408 [Blakeslea trispora]